MSVVAALGNYTNWRERQEARRNHNPLATNSQDDEDDENAPVAESSSMPSPPESPTETTPAITPSSNNDDSPPSGDGAAQASATSGETTTAARPSATSTVRARRISTTTSREIPLGDDASGAATTEQDELENFDVRAITGRTDHVTLAELEEERELARRRTSACVLLAVFILFRLWIEAIMTSDFGLLMLCLVGTSWTARWIRHNREREDELDRRIQAYMERSEDGTAVVNRRDLQMLSFQAQLALAIMESQRNMMEGNFGHPDGPQNRATGVSEEAKRQWEEFSFKADPSSAAPTKKKKGGYGSVAQEEDEESPIKRSSSDDSEDDLLEEAPSCTICLGEYEEGEKLVKLPCGHVYHEECVDSWTTNHVRCPLCNFDLESVASDSASTTDSTVTTV